MSLQLANVFRVTLTESLFEVKDQNSLATHPDKILSQTDSNTAATYIVICVRKGKKL